ncbi:MAG: hypothetical protein ACLFNX_12145 [Spirochaetaceae bacterium]
MASRTHYVLLVSIIAVTLAGCAHMSPEPSGPEPEDDGGAVAAEPPEEEPAAAEDPQDAEPPAESTPEPADLVAAALDVSPAGTHPIRMNTDYLAVTVDFDANGRTDVALLTVGADAGETPPDFAELSARGRLSGESAAVSEFFFEIYLNRPDGLVLFETRRIGRFPVLEGMSAVELNTEGELPRAVSVHFQDEIGRKEVWLVAGRDGFSDFVLERTPVIKSSAVDIDEDGIIDVLKAQTAFEEGRGYETFLTWYRWNGRSYAPHATANIVRNLNNFLRTLEGHLVSGRYARFLRSAAPEAETTSAGASEATLYRSIAELFAPDVEALEPPEIAGGGGIDEAESPAPLDEILAEYEIAGVAFPDFLENPFPSPGERTTTLAPLRIDVRDGGTFFYRTLIVMNSNPFEERQFRLSSPP